MEVNATETKPRCSRTSAHGPVVVDRPCCRPSITIETLTSCTPNAHQRTSHGRSPERTRASVVYRRECRARNRHAALPCHKGVLSLYSTVLRDMFDLPIVPADSDNEPSTHGAINPDVYDGLPLVVMSGEKGEDLMHLLRAIYERECVIEISLPWNQTDIPLKSYYDRDDDDTPLEKIIALFSLSAKYDVPTVRKDVLKQLARIYPTTLAEYEAMSNRTAELFGRSRHKCHFPLLRACITSQEDIQIILPALFYACSNAMPINEIIKEEAPSLALPVLQTVLLGERALADNMRRYLSWTLDDASPPPAGCPHSASNDVCTTARRHPETQAIIDLFSTTELSEIVGEDVVDAFFVRRCDLCREHIVRNLNNIRNHVWEQVPEYFGLTSWEEVGRED